MGGQQQHLNGWVAVEALHQAEPLLGLHTAMQVSNSLLRIGYTKTYLANANPVMHLSDGLALKVSKSIEYQGPYDITAY